MRLFSNKLIWAAILTLCPVLLSTTDASIAGTDREWTELAGTNLSGGLARRGMRYIYGWGGDGEPRIIRYDITANTWKSLIPYNLGHDCPVRGCSDSDGLTYWVDRSRYSEMAGVSWYDGDEAYTSSPFIDGELEYYPGGGIAYLSGCVYIRGDAYPPGQEKVLLRFYRPLRRWAVMTSMPEEADLCDFDSEGMAIYAVASGSDGIYRYLALENRWEHVSSPPWREGLGRDPAIVFDPRDKMIYILQDQKTNKRGIICSYSIIDDVWDEYVTTTPVTTFEGRDIAFAHGQLYFANGNGYFGRIKLRDDLSSVLMGVVELSE